MILLADPDKAFRGRVARELGRPEDLMQLDELSSLTRLVEDPTFGAEVAIVGPGIPTAEALRAAAHMQIHRPELAVILVADDPSPDLLRSALRSGVKDVLFSGFTGEQLREAITLAESLSRQLKSRPNGEAAHAAKTTSKVVTIFSSKGGTGKSFTASNLAVLLAKETGSEVALVDLDLESGDLALMLQVTPAWTIKDAADHIERLDAEALAGYTTSYGAGVALLAAPTEPAAAHLITPEAVRRIINLLKERFPYVVVDGPSSFTDHVLAAIDESDLCVLVASMDVPSIKNLKMALQTLAQLEIPRERIRLLLNRADSKVGLRVSEVEKTLGTSVDLTVPSSRLVPLSVNQGIPLAVNGRKSPVVSELARLLSFLRTPTSLPQTAKRGLFARRR